MKEPYWNRAEKIVKKPCVIFPVILVLINSN